MRGPTTPIGIALYKGYRTGSDLWYGQLAMHSPAPTLCSLILLGMTSFVFAPNSDNATFCGPSCDTRACPTRLMRFEASLSGYWIVLVELGGFFAFSPGVYTIVGGDEWGDLLLLHFAVS
jgi:hypothetical protein